MKSYSASNAAKEKEQKRIRDLFHHVRSIGSHSVFENEIKTLIATAFKSQLGEIRHSLKNIKVLKSKSKVDAKQEILNSYKNGLKIDLLNKAEKLV